MFSVDLLWFCSSHWSVFLGSSVSRTALAAADSIPTNSLHATDSCSLSLICRSTTSKSSTRPCMWLQFLSLGNLRQIWSVVLNQNAWILAYSMSASLRSRLVLQAITRSAKSATISSGVWKVKFSNSSSISESNSCSLPSSSYSWTSQCVVLQVQHLPLLCPPVRDCWESHQSLFPLPSQCSELIVLWNCHCL